MSRVIKGKGETQSLSRRVEVIASGGVVPRDVLSAKERAQQILDDAFEEATVIREEASRVLAGTKAAREEAKRQGFAEGVAKGRAEVTELLLKLQAMKEEFYKHAEPEVIKLVMEIARKVIGELVKEHAEAVQSVVAKALERSIGDHITVRVNPADYKDIVANESSFRTIIDRTKRLHFKEDETILRGGCVVETEVGTIDAELETQLEAIRKALES